MSLLKWSLRDQNGNLVESGVGTYLVVADKAEEFIRLHGMEQGAHGRIEFSPYTPAFSVKPCPLAAISPFCIVDKTGSQRAWFRDEILADYVCRLLNNKELGE